MIGMGKIMQINCDSCKRDITGTDYQTFTFRRYTGKNHEKVFRMPTIWLCDKCYKKMAMYMAFPPFDADVEHGGH